MNAAPALLGYAAVVGFLAPQLMLRSTWPHRAPALAVVVWHGLAVSFTAALALAAYHLAVPTEHLHAGLVGLLHACGLSSSSSAPSADIADGLAIALPILVILLPLSLFAYELVRASRARSRHRRTLDMVGRRSSRLRATVLEHDLPAAYCLPGHSPRIVVSEGALRLLSDEQLDAVLEHERAHVAGRHHLPRAAAEAFARLFRRLPLARHAKEQTAILLEMIADDRAMRRHPREVLATAMYEMAAGKAPAGGFAVGGPTALVRMRRVLAAQRRPHVALRGSVAAAALLVPLLPLLVGCPPVVG
ncbi:M56 family metallopeptidase [Streptomyces sp. NBC_00160]|uniref:M56 family metallopeptidase n=1 Tax=Streptomyces sp. NBC_00160 TaxID=2903628 RepID=UPI00225528A3|nr:M56 family metallopeptidase [Streptomyces sp. NBC_00160]MCX5302772.1 M56 family metallopeptidase [Streptomyces sp. NBC_00160]